MTAMSSDGPRGRILIDPVDRVRRSTSRCADRRPTARAVPCCRRSAPHRRVAELKGETLRGRSLSHLFDRRDRAKVGHACGAEMRQDTIRFPASGSMSQPPSKSSAPFPRAMAFRPLSRASGSGRTLSSLEETEPRGAGGARPRFACGPVWCAARAVFHHAGVSAVCRRRSHPGRRIARASRDYRLVGQAEQARHRATFHTTDAAALRDLFAIVGRLDACEVFIDGRPVPHAREFWLPLVWFLLPR